MAANGKRRPPWASIEVTGSVATPAEAAAIAAALEQFLAETAPAPEAGPAPGGWQRAALAEGVDRAPHAEVWGSARQQPTASGA